MVWWYGGMEIAFALWCQCLACDKIYTCRSHLYVHVVCGHRCTVRGVGYNQDVLLARGTRDEGRRRIEANSLCVRGGLPGRSIHDGGGGEGFHSPLSACGSLACVLAAVMEGTLRWWALWGGTDPAGPQWVPDSVRGGFPVRGAPYRVTDAMWLFCITSKIILCSPKQNVDPKGLVLFADDDL